MNSRLYRLNRVLPERTNLFSHQPFVNRIDVSKSDHGRYAKTPRLSLSFIKSVFMLGAGSFGTDGNDDNVTARAVPSGGRNNQRRPLFVRSVIGERERQKHDIRSITLGHTSRPSDYPRNQENFGQESSSRSFRCPPHRYDFGNLFDSVSRGATKVAAYLQISTNQQLAQFGPKRDFAYANSILRDRTKLQGDVRIYPSTTNSLRSFGYPPAPRLRRAGGAGNRALTYAEVQQLYSSR